MSRSIILLTIVAAACGRDPGDIDEVVGSPCASDGDCDTRCYLDTGRFPGGFCSLPCTSDDDCTVDTYCVETDGGVCLFRCPAFDCARLGPAWECNGKPHVGGDTVEVCTGT